MAVRIEDAGFEIRDMIAWVYGSGFPKSLDVSKAIDKRGGATVGFESFRDAVKTAMNKNQISRAKLQEALGNFMLSHYLTAGSQPAIPNWRDYQVIRDTVGLGDAYDEMFRPEAEREVVGQKTAGIANPDDRDRHTIGGSAAVVVDITAPSTPEAKQWQGWGTALKPALEPITVARKPLIGTVAENVLQHGTGAINVDGGRVGTESTLRTNGKTAIWADGGMNSAQGGSAQGRWPANFIHDGSEEVLQLFPVTKSGSILPHHQQTSDSTKHSYEGGYAVKSMISHGDSGSAARFFYCAKASKADRGENHHPTVKPTDLMRYLCRLVTPPSGIVLDPFMGSGSTGKAAMMEGFAFVGIEREAEYIDIAKARIQSAVGLL
jgi:hypothetical protein